MGYKTATATSTATASASASASASNFRGVPVALGNVLREQHIHTHLPTEILAQIISHLDSLDIKTLRACCLVSTQWYSASVASLYDRPVLSNNNFDKFTATLCPPRFTKDRAPKHDLGNFIHRLDLSAIGASGSASIVSRLLSRTRKNLEVFVAPTYSFSVDSLIPLSKSGRLRRLDLRNAVGLKEVMKELCSLSSHFPSLHHLALPRQRNFPEHANKPLIIPISLRHLSFSGFIPDIHTSHIELPGYAVWPETLVNLTFTDCHFRHLMFDSDSPITDLLRHSYPGFLLKSLYISSKQDCLVPQAVQGLEDVAPNITSLSLPTDLAVPYIWHVVAASSQFQSLGENSLSVHQKLERLEILSPSYSMPPVRNPCILSLRQLTEKLPSLWLIEIHCDDGEEDDEEEILETELTEAKLQQNAKTLNISGRQPPIREENAGLFYVTE